MPDASSPESAALAAISLIAVVEDDLTANRLREVLARAEGARYEVVRVLCVEEALLTIRKTSFDAMLIDLSVHEGYGLDSLMRATAAAASIPIIVLTYQRDEATALKAARAGAQDCLSKGEVTPDLLSRAIVHAIERHRILQDLTEAKQRQRFLANHDTLTELPNRYSFLEQLKTAIDTSARRGTELAVIYFDLDGFKAVNDNLGHKFGDELLADVAKRLRKATRKTDIVARIGGDEFLAAIQDIKSEETPVQIAEMIRTVIEKPYHLNGIECWITASVGIAVYPRHGASSEQLIQSADTAMYEVKNSGKNRVCMFDGEMNDKAVERFKLVNGLREAIHSGQLLLMYQPQIQTATEEIVGVETLVRWIHPTRGIVSPSDFIEVAEETGVMVQLGEWVLRNACEAAASWKGMQDVRIAVNISGRQLDEANFPERVRWILDETGLPPSRLEIELTESLAASESTMRVVNKLRESGIRVAIDDFGTGYSSLTLLRRLPVDMLKIDQSFVRGAAQAKPDRVILEAIIHMARGLGIEVMAEGVENIEEMRALLDRGCTLMQGYLFCKPLDRKRIADIASDPDASWRIPIVDPDSWVPAAESAVASAPATAASTVIGRIGLTSSADFDPDEDLYPVIKPDRD